MNLLELPFEHRNWSVGKDFDLIREFNPLGRVPTLVLDDGEALIDSAAILDHLDETAGADRALLPRSGRERRDALRVMAIAVGAAEKGVQQVYESVFRPEDRRHPPWVDRCRVQMLGALGELDRVARARGDHWLVGERLSQADVTTACVYTFLREAVATDAAGDYSGLMALSGRCEGLPAFQAAKAVFAAPRQDG